MLGALILGSVAITVVLLVISIGAGRGVQDYSTEPEYRCGQLNNIEVRYGAKTQWKLIPNYPCLKPGPMPVPTQST